MFGTVVLSGRRLAVQPDEGPVVLLSWRNVTVVTPLEELAHIGKGLKNPERECPQPGQRVRVRRSEAWGGETVYGTVERVTPSYVRPNNPWRVYVLLDGVRPSIPFPENCVEEVSPLEELAAQLRKNPDFSRGARVRTRVRQGRKNRAATAYGTIMSEGFGHPARWYPVNFDNGRWQICRGDDLEFLSPLEELAALAEKNPSSREWRSKDFRHDPLEELAALGRENPKKKNPVPPAAAVPQLVFSILQTLGLEVGDYHRDVHWVTQGRKAYQLRLEGWGEECVPGKGRRAAERAAAQLAETWRAEGWPQAGWLKVQDRDVWAVTWALRGAFPLKVIRDDDIDPEKVIRL